MVSNGFQVVMSDLEKMSGTFHTESATFKVIMPANGPARPDGGSAEFNDALSLMLEAVSGLHLQLSAVIGQHGEKLQAAHSNYAHAEVTLTQLAHDLGSAVKNG
jgi:Family of unknown function (DUF6317)